jgi:phospholipid/cholesterol/gamma-HCH transport system substrate-binding protein
MRRSISLLVLVFLFAGSACSFNDGGENPTVIAYFADAGDLVTKGSVQTSDVEVGRIDNIEMVNRDGELFAKVTMSIAPDVQIRSTSMSALVRQTSLLGEQFVELLPGAETGPYLSPDAVTVIPPERTDRRVDIETFLADLSGFIGQGGLQDLNRFTHAQALILQERSGEFGETIEELEEFTGILANRRLDIAAAIDSLANASTELASNRDTLDSFLDSLEDANRVLAQQGDKLGRLFRSLHTFGRFNVRFLREHQGAITRQFKALRPVLEGLAGAEDALRTDISQLNTFFRLFPKSFGGGPGGTGAGDYVQIDAVVCENLENCQSKGEKGDVPGEGS